MTELTQDQRIALMRRRLELQQQRQSEPALSQTNLGIADAVGGLIDFINPFDTPAVSEALGLGDRLTTGSAREGLVSGMQATGMAGEDRAPEGLGEAMLRGGGQAAGAMIPAAGVARVGAMAPGIAGRASGELARGMATRGAPTAEVAAGAAAGGAMQAADDAGLPDWAVGLAGVAAPLGLAGTVAGTQAAGRVAGRVSPVNNAARMVSGAVAPYTRRGAEAVARRRMEDLAGGRERAIELGERINPNDEFGLTPAQQTGDSRMIALEQAARSQSPVLDEQLTRRLDESLGVARDGARVGGDASEAQRFFREELARQTTEMRSVANQAVRNAEQRLQGIEAQRRPSENSRIVMEEVERARDVARGREQELWAEVPRAASIGTDNARSTAQSLLDDTSRAQGGDFPRVAKELLLGEDGLGDSTSVMELHGLYSRLRQIAREASAGPAPNENRARIANQIAEGILDDLGARDGTDAVGQAVNRARAFSRALHETFDMGAYGRLSRQTAQGDTVTDPRVALDRSVGSGAGTGRMTDAENLETAAAGVSDGPMPPQPNERARGAIVDFVRGRFADSAFTPDARGNEVLNPRGARQFINSNRELLERYPELRQEILDAGDQQRTADQVAETIARRIEAVENTRTNPVAGFADAAQENAIRSILDAENPVRAAQAIRSTAQRDETGAALDGVKAVFSDELIRRASRPGGDLDATTMRDMMRDPQFRAAMSRILSPAEIRRLDRVVDVVRRINMADTVQPRLDGQTLSGAQAPRFIQFIARIAGAQAANAAPMAQGGGAGVGLQAAQLGSSAARDAVGSLTADRASRILADAITDPRLFQSLLMDPASPRFEREALPRLIPYLVGGGAAAAMEDDPSPLRMELTDPGNQRRSQ